MQGKSLCRIFIRIVGKFNYKKKLNFEIAGEANDKSRDDKLISMKNRTRNAAGNCTKLKGLSIRECGYPMLIQLGWLWIVRCLLFFRNWGMIPRIAGSLLDKGLITYFQELDAIAWPSLSRGGFVRMRMRPLNRGSFLRYLSHNKAIIFINPNVLAGVGGGAWGRTGRRGHVIEAGFLIPIWWPDNQYWLRATEALLPNVTLL